MKLSPNSVTKLFQSFIFSFCVETVDDNHHRQPRFGEFVGFLKAVGGQINGETKLGCLPIRLKVPFVGITDYRPLPIGFSQ